MNDKTAANTDSAVCVIVPVYNGEKTIKGCLSSILRQSYRDILVVAVDDGSTDRTPEIIARMAKRDSRLIPIRQSNSGSISARKAGIRYARDHGIPFLCFCDADDRLPRESVEKMVSAMFKTDSDLICGDMKCRWHFISVPNSFKSKCLRIGAPVLYSKEEIKEKLIISYFGVSNFPVSFWAKLYKTSCIARFVDDDPIVWFYGEDLSVTLKIMLTIDSLCIIPDTVYYYQTGGATGKWMPTMFEDFLSLYQYRRTVIEKYNLNPKFSVYLAIEAMNFIKKYFSDCLEYKIDLPGDRSTFLKTIEKIISMPVFSEAAGLVIQSGRDNIIAILVNSGDTDAIAKLIEEKNRADRKSIKGIIRRILNKIG